MSIRRSSQNFDPRIVQTVRNLRESQNINQIRKDHKAGTSIEREKSNFLQQNLNLKMNNTNNHISINSVSQNPEKKNYPLNLDEYKEIGLNIIKADKELMDYWNFLYKDDSDDKIKEWLNKKLFDRKIFSYKLETKLNNNDDISTFLFKEINKFKNNEYLDVQYKLKVEDMEKIFEEHMAKINNLYN
jgi:hypothetical protein